jgi:ABC-type multidrug transport system permease subunit
MAEHAPPPAGGRWRLPHALERTAAIAVKETRELLRDPVYLGLSFVIPLVMILLFGFGLSLDVKNLPLVFADHDRSPYSRDYIDAYVHSEYFNLIAVDTDPAQLDRLLRAGTARVIIDIPPDFGRRIASSEPVSIGVTVDGSFPTRAGVINGYVAAVNALYNERLLREARGEGTVLPVQMDLSVWYNPSLESKNTIVPGLLVLILMLFPAILGALLVVREKESGTIFNFFASPVRRGEIILGKLLPYLAVALLDYLMIFGLSLLVFQVRFVGSVFVLSVGALLYSVCTIGIGMLISILTRTQLAAMLVTFLATVTPAFNYSGFITPVGAMDRVGQLIAQFIPATHFMSVVRGSYLKGLGLDFYWPQLGALAVYTVVVYGLCWVFLKKRIG